MGADHGGGADRRAPVLPPPASARPRRPGGSDGHRRHPRRRQPAPPAPLGADVVVRRAPTARSTARGEGIYLYDDARPPADRRPRRHVVRADRPRPARDGRGHRRAGDAPVLQLALGLGQRAGGAAGAQARGAGARRPQHRHVHHRRLHRGRHGAALHALLQQPARAGRRRSSSSRARSPTTARPTSRPASRAASGSRAGSTARTAWSTSCPTSTRACGPPGIGARRAGPRRKARDLEDAILRARARPGRRVHRRADPGLGRGRRSPRPATTSAASRSAGGTTCCYIADEVVTAFGRLGHWFASKDVFGDRARHDHLRQGPDLGLPAARRLPDLRPADGRGHRRGRTRTCCSPTATPTPATRSAAPRRSKNIRDHRGRGAARSTSGRSRRTSRSGCTRCARTPSSATRAAWAWSAASRAGRAARATASRATSSSASGSTRCARSWG